MRLCGPIGLLCSLLLAPALVSCGMDATVGEGTSSAEVRADPAQRPQMVLVGDSRTTQLSYLILDAPYGAYDDLRMYTGALDGDFIVSESGMGFDWLLAQEPTIDWLLDEDTALVINLGVNDVASTEAYAERYVEWLNAKARELEAKGVPLWFVTAGPVDEMAEVEFGFDLTNAQIEEFNNRVVSGLDGRVHVCDAYAPLRARLDEGTLETQDGLHYSPDIYQEVYDLICAEVKG